MKRTKRLRRMVDHDHYDHDDLMISMLCDGATWSNSCEKIWQGRCQTKWWTCNVQNQFWKQKIIPGQLGFLKIIFWFIICFVLIFSFWPQSISSQRSKGKEIRALKSPSASWEHKNRGGHSQTSKFNLVKRNMRDCLKYFPIYRYFQTAISGLGQYVKGSNTTWCIGWNWSDLRGTLTLDVLVVCKTPSTLFGPLKIPPDPIVLLKSPLLCHKNDQRTHQLLLIIWDTLDGPPRNPVG